MCSIDFYEKMGRYSCVGGLEARVGDDERMEELKRKVAPAVRMARTLE